MTSKELEISELISETLVNKKYETPVSVQEQAISVTLSDWNVLGASQTGADKTAAFTILAVQNPGQLHKLTCRKSNTILIA